MGAAAGAAWAVEQCRRAPRAVGGAGTTRTHSCLERTHIRAELHARCACRCPRTRASVGAAGGSYCVVLTRGWWWWWLQVAGPGAVEGQRQRVLRCGAAAGPQRHCTSCLLHGGVQALRHFTLHPALLLRARTRRCAWQQRCALCAGGALGAAAAACGCACCAGLLGPPEPLRSCATRMRSSCALELWWHAAGMPGLGAVLAAQALAAAAAGRHAAHMRTHAACAC